MLGYDRGRSAAASDAPQAIFIEIGIWRTRHDSNV